MWRRWLWLSVLLLLYLAQSNARIQPLQHRRAKSVVDSRGQNSGANTESVGANGECFPRWLALLTLLRECSPNPMWRS